MKRRLFLGATAAASPIALLAAAPAASGNDAPPLAPATRGKFPNVLLTTHEGKRLRFYDDVIRGNKIIVLNMMYTQCPDVCGGTMVNLARVQNVLGERVGRDVFFYSISLDPGHDTPAMLARYAKLVGIAPGWQLLTGRPTDIERLRRALRYVDPDPRVDRDRTQHIGMVRMGNDAVDRWISCPGMAPAEQLARQAVRIGLATSVAT